MRTLAPSVLCVVAAMLLVRVAALPERAVACAVVGRATDTTLLPQIGAEKALIVYDSVRRIQHFIRRAEFGHAHWTEKFGFLVPTPGVPTLHEANDSIYGELHAMETPRIERDILWSFFLMTMGRSERAMPQAGRAAPDVEVLERRRIGSLDAAVLRASSATALTSWLSAHGFATNPNVEPWLRPYIAQNFAITAFQYAANQESTLDAESVRLTFETPRPFYPYSEPAGTGGPGSRSLDVAVVSTGRARASIARVEEGLAYAAPLTEENVNALARSMGIDRGAMPANAWVTRFADRPSTRGAEDLHFDIDAHGAEQRPVIHQDPILIPAFEVALLGGLIGLFMWRRRQSRTS